MTSPTLAYTVEDYKKYIYAEGRAHLCRIQESIEAINESVGLGDEDREDLSGMLGTAMGYLWAAAFGTDQKTTTAKMTQDMYEAQRASDKDIDWPIRQALSTDTYDDGRPVATGLRYGERDDEYVVHVWHPDPDDPRNQPGAMSEESQGPHPWRWLHVYVVAPGVISVVKEEDDEEQR